MTWTLKKKKYIYIYIYIYIFFLYLSHPKLYHSLPHWHLQYEQKTTGFQAKKTKTREGLCTDVLWHNNLHEKKLFSSAWLR